MQLAGIIFDMDGTLLDTERLALRAWKATERQTGVTFPDGFVISIIGANSRTAHAKGAEALGSVPAAEAFFDAYRESYHRHMEEEGLPIKRGAREILEWSQANHLRLALATSTRRAVAAKKLDRTGFDHFFDVVVCGDEVENGKPAPDIFAKACALLSLKTEHVVAIEDSPNGVRSATAAGIRTLLIPDLAPISPAVAELAWKVSENLAEAQILLQNWVQPPLRQGAYLSG